ncbi:AAA family ATPase [Mesoterricola silvestris]|uniref:ATPase dynein-related AAA domain-containing protein n=1 Tax=Mesoterricola silvestris TaxID=2927979 RepID=A0AA48H9C0_9BACT|nr:AAA family ATPase [Mesoterricola silvestris]BDU74163.1 hypothetical protein METEAL_33370 [Mesoterricola silvestris]
MEVLNLQPYSVVTEKPGGHGLTFRDHGDLQFNLNRAFREIRANQEYLAIDGSHLWQISFIQTPCNGTKQYLHFKEEEAQELAEVGLQWLNPVEDQAQVPKMGKEHILELLGSLRDAGKESFWNWAIESHREQENHFASLLSTNGIDPIGCFKVLLEADRSGPFWRWAVQIDKEGRNNLARLFDLNALRPFLEEWRAQFWEEAGRRGDVLGWFGLVDEWMDFAARGSRLSSQPSVQKASPLPLAAEPMPAQTIYFGPPGTGKSWTIAARIASDKPSSFPIQFHPEYTYGDFFGKLVPLTVNDPSKPDEHRIDYRVHLGPFLKALSKAYTWMASGQSNASNGSGEVCLVIDEINRGNCAAIFGETFQLLDREIGDRHIPHELREEGPVVSRAGWSSYHIELPPVLRKAFFEYFLEALLEGTSEEGLEFPKEPWKDAAKVLNRLHEGGEPKVTPEDFPASPIAVRRKEDFALLRQLAHDGLIALPPNLHILASMNTSDESVFFMDSAFKRRWDWEHVGIGEVAPTRLSGIRVEGKEYTWCELVGKVNAFLKANADRIRGIDDKQIGYWFIKPEPSSQPGNAFEVSLKSLKGKLLHYLWDSVFSRDRRPLKDLLPDEARARTVTFGDFVGGNNLELILDRLMTM